MNKYKTPTPRIPKSFGSYLAQLKDDQSGINFIVWSKFMWMCHIDNIQPHTLTSFSSVYYNLERFYKSEVRQWFHHISNLADKHHQELYPDFDAFDPTSGF